jgi:EcsC protein family
MLKDMARLHNAAPGGVFGRFARFGLLRGLRSLEIDREEFRRQLKKKHGLEVADFRHMHRVPVARLDAIAKSLIQDTERLALLEGAGFGLGGMITIIPDAGLLTILTLRLIQRLCLLYGFEERGQSERVELWMAAAAATGVDYGKDLAEKQILERLAPRIAERLAVKLGQETAEKWVGRLIPLASSVIGGALNYAFVRAWGGRVQRNLRMRHVAGRPTVVSPSSSPASYTTAARAVLV